MRREIDRSKISVRVVFSEIQTAASKLGQVIKLVQLAIWQRVLSNFQISFNQPDVSEYGKDSNDQCTGQTKKATGA